MLEGGGAEEPLRDDGGPALRAIRWIIRAWAVYVGGGLLVGLVVLTTVSAVTNLLWHKPIPGDYELVKHFMAIAIFTFLPYCEMVGGNITVDVFTERAGPRARAWMALLSALFAVAFSVVLLRQTYLGYLDYRRAVEVTSILSVPLWTAFPPILVSIVLWIIAAVMSLTKAVRGTRTVTPEAGAAA